MSTELAVVYVDLAATMAAWLGTKSQRTREEYAKGLTCFAAFVGAVSPANAVETLLECGRGAAARTAELWKASMLQRGLAAATVNQRLSALRSVVDVARKHEIVEWHLDVDGVKPEPKKDSRGPKWSDYERLVAAEPLARNRAILRLLGDRGLRRTEIANLDVGDFDGVSIFVRGKGRREKEPLSLNERTHAALDAWLDERGLEPGSLFGLTGDRVHAIVAQAGKRIGIVARPHGLRHCCLTRALDVTHGDVRKVQMFARHASAETTLLYDDKRKDHAGEVAAMVGG